MTGRIVVTLLFCAAAPLSAQEENPDPIESNLFPPELVMQHRAQLSLSEAQRDAITDAIRTLQNSVLDLEWDMQDARQELARVLSPETVDLEAARAAMNRMLDLERSVKLAHVSALIIIKNALTAEQRATLTRVREANPPGRF